MKLLFGVELKAADCSPCCGLGELGLCEGKNVKQVERNRTRKEGNVPLDSDVAIPGAIVRTGIQKQRYSFKPPAAACLD